MIRSVRSLMIIAGLCFGGFSFSTSFAQDAEDEVLAIGAVRLVPGSMSGKKVIIHDEDKGDIELLLTPALTQTIDQYPAESYEAEGTVTNAQMTVNTLRPIE